MIGNRLEQRAGLQGPERRSVYVEPNKWFKIEPPRDWLKNLTIIRSLPITFHVSFGPYTRERVKSGDLGISIACLSKEYEALLSDTIFEDSTGDQRAISSSYKWREVQTGKTGPMLFPSGADFRQIAFIIKDSASE